MEFQFSAPLWEWEGKASWHFVTVPGPISEDIREVPRMPRGFGSVRVQATIGSTSWSTSLFPSSAEQGYILPIKKAVRLAEELLGGDTAEVRVRLLE